MIHRFLRWLHQALPLHGPTRTTPLGSLTYRQVNPHVKLEDGIKRARERTYVR